MSNYDMVPDHYYLTNVNKTYLDGNPDPSPDLISYWTPYLEDEIRQVSPKLIVCVGRFSAQWFLGPDTDMESCHGLPHTSPRYPGVVILPVIHPASGFYQPKSKALIAWDYSQVARVWELIRTGQSQKINYRHDPYAGKEQYHDVTGNDLASILAFAQPHEIGLDTEGIPSNPWSVQISHTPGAAYTLRLSQPDFHAGISALQQHVDTGCLIITHDAGTPQGCLYDTIMCRAMGLELSRARLWNTMYAAYLLRIESKSLKTLLYRWCGMQMEDYMSLVSGIGREKQIDYLLSASSRKWSKAEPYISYENNGEYKLNKPKSINSRIDTILKDILNEKRNKEGELTDPYKRWKDVDVKLRVEVERELGPMPIATLDDVELERAVFYAGRDADGSLRLKHSLELELKRLELI